MVNGRKRHILCDTLGLLWGVCVHAANIQERDGAKLLLSLMRALGVCLPRVQVCWVDAGYRGDPFAAWVQAVWNWALTVVKRATDAVGFQLLPHRWIVERTFGWFANFRRLDKDYEVLPTVSESTLYWAMVHVMVRRLTQGQVRWKEP